MLDKSIAMMAFDAQWVTERIWMVRLDIFGDVRMCTVLLLKSQFT